MRGSDDVTREITLALERVGLNRAGTLTVETSHVGYRFTTRIRGVDPQLAQAALTVYSLNRPFISWEIVNDSLLFTQWQGDQ
jgi:hypothetical protein